MSNKIRIRLKAYDHRILDQAGGRIVEAVKRNQWTNSTTNRD